MGRRSVPRFHHRVTEGEPHTREDVDRIDAQFAAALAYVKRAQMFRIDPWGQKLPGASEQRIAGKVGSTTRDNGVSLRVRSLA